MGDEWRGDECDEMQNGMFHGAFVEQFVSFFVKIKQIFNSKCAFRVVLRPFFEIIRILFRYTDNCRELCGHEKGLSYLFVLRGRGLL